MKFFNLLENFAGACTGFDSRKRYAIKPKHSLCAERYVAGVGSFNDVKYASRNSFDKSYIEKMFAMDHVVHEMFIRAPFKQEAPVAVPQPKPVTDLSYWYTPTTQHIPVPKMKEFCGVIPEPTYTKPRLLLDEPCEIKCSPMIKTFNGKSYKLFTYKQQTPRGEEQVTVWYRLNKTPLSEEEVIKLQGVTIWQHAPAIRSLFRIENLPCNFMYLYEGRLFRYVEHPDRKVGTETAFFSIITMEQEKQN